MKSLRRYQVFCDEINCNKEYVKDFVRRDKQYFNDDECRACLLCLKYDFFTPKHIFGLPFRDDRQYQFCKIRHKLETKDYVWNIYEKDLNWLERLTCPIKYKEYLRHVRQK